MGCETTSNVFFERSVANTHIHNCKIKTIKIDAENSWEAINTNMIRWS
jgi:hypothetical protein